jgi:hypothetical protein
MAVCLWEHPALLIRPAGCDMAEVGRILGIVKRHTLDRVRANIGVANDHRRAVPHLSR